MKKWLAPVLLLSILAGCGGGIAPSARVERVDPRLAAANVRFSIDLLKQVYKGENLFLSPASASVILSLTASGAEGETRQAMLQTLRYPAMTMEEVNQANGDIQSLLTGGADPKVMITSANGIWHAQELKVDPAFRDVARKHYRAEVRGVTMGPEAVKAINDWTAKATRQKIPTLLDRLDPNAIMVLVNALYFKGEWAEPFKPENTADGTFTRADGSTRQVPFMYRQDQLGYLAADGVRGVRLPYGDDRVALYALLPDRWEGFVAGLTPERWQGWMAGFERREVRLTMPKVKLESTAELLDGLKAMGMERPADPERAEFGGLFSQGPPAYIGRVLQKSYLEIDEKGTEAAAATLVEMRSGSAPNREEPPAVRLDRPFLLAIRDDRTGVILFLGLVMEP